MPNICAENLRALRRERHLSQKDAAARLEVSQALLSHYEKGVRECGLEFLIRAAAFYEVSCDRLLGVENELPHAAQPEELRTLLDSCTVLYGLLRHQNNEEATRQTLRFLRLALYRMICPLPSESETVGLVSLPVNLARACADAAMQSAEAVLITQAAHRSSPPPGYPDTAAISEEFGDKFYRLTELLLAAERELDRTEDFE